MVEEALSFWTEIQRFEDMLAADPRSLSFAPLSELYRKLGLLDDAISVAQKGCELHPEFQGGFFALGTACLEKGLKARARLALERTVLLSPENVHAQRFLGKLYVEAGENALAQRALGQVLQHDPDDAEIALLLRSIATAAVSDAIGEENLEEAEIIEELTDVLDEAYEEATEAAPARLAAPAPVQKPSYVPESFEVADFSDFAEAAGLPEHPQHPEFPEFPELPEHPALPEFPELPEVLEIPEIFEVFDASDGEASSQESAAHPARNPLTTATLAELYVSQGYLDRAITIYHELLQADPANHAFRLRCTELKTVQERQKEAAFSPAPVLGSGSHPVRDECAAPQRMVDAELSRWLENIRRRKDGV
jgi:tetratricopeptide (TPR) repeat protein